MLVTNVCSSLLQIITSAQDFKRGLWLGARVKLTRSRFDSDEPEELYAVLEQFHFAWCWVHLEDSGERIKCRIGQLKLCEQVRGRRLLRDHEYVLLS